MKTHYGRKIVNRTCLLLVISMFTQPVSALPPDPDNAALLYYQAFLIYEKPDDTMQDMVENLAKGRIEPNPTITRYIENCRPAIELAVSASELAHCDWGMKYTDGLSMQMPCLSQTRHLSYIILAEARIASAEEDYDLAIDRCLTARRLALQVAGEPIAISFLVGKAIERQANKCIRDIVSSYKIEPETIQYLKAQLEELDSRVKSIEFFLETEREVMAMYIIPERIREVLPYVGLPGFEEADADRVRKFINTADEEFCQRSLKYFNEYWNEIFSSLELPYRRAYTRLEELGEKPRQDCGENPDAIMTALLAPAVKAIYNHDIHKRSSSNALKTALEIYIVAAQTGQLPHCLPAGMPKDLFSNEDFEYEKTDTGFILRCRGKDLKEDTIHEYEFNVQQ